MPASESHEVRLLIAELSRMNSELVTRHRVTARETADVLETSRLVREYVGKVAHDLASPLAVVRGLAELLAEDPALSPASRDRVHRLQRSAAFMGSLLQGLGDVTGRRPVDGATRPVEVRDLADAVVARYQVLSAHRGITVEVESAAGLPGGTVVLGDVRDLERVVDNLVGNAVKYSPDGATVTVRVSVSGPSVLVAVVDHGPGIAPEQHRAVFEQFHREPGTAGVPGVGLGLSIARDLAVAHGGTITVDSRLGQGATFTLALPAASPTARSTSGQAAEPGSTSAK